MKRGILACVAREAAFRAAFRVQNRFSATSLRAIAAYPDETPGKKISFVNFPSRDGVEGRRTVQFREEADFLAYLARNRVSALEEVHPSGKGKLVMELAGIDPMKEYIICYTKSAIESRLVNIEGFTRNSAGAFEDRANIALVSQLRHQNHMGVEVLCDKVKLRWGNEAKGDIDGLVVTDTHIFVVEAKIHAVVCACFWLALSASRSHYRTFLFTFTDKYAPARGYSTMREQCCPGTRSQDVSAAARSGRPEKA